DSVALTPETLAAADAVIIVTGHHAVDYTAVLEHAPLVIDSCNATRSYSGKAAVVRLGAPAPR
ncbi:MAG TPA: UDP-N-acetyl-D-glucosamine dehydrogenase, partial [Anaerolineae bacterium]|nr:UDP-N-acetyl-D-glucosamine dehydrogenase [Anaerolineae bacterium]